MELKTRRIVHTGITKYPTERELDAQAAESFTHSGELLSHWEVASRVAYLSAISRSPIRPNLNEQKLARTIWGQSLSGSFHSRDAIFTSYPLCQIHTSKDPVRRDYQFDILDFVHTGVIQSGFRGVYGAWYEGLECRHFFQNCIDCGEKQPSAKLTNCIRRYSYADSKCGVLSVF